MPESYKEKYKKLKLDYNERKKKRDILRQLLSVAQARCKTLNDEIDQLLDLIMESNTFSDSSDTDSSDYSFRDSNDSDSSKDTSISYHKQINDNSLNKKRRNVSIIIKRTRKKLNKQKIKL